MLTCVNDRSVTLPLACARITILKQTDRRQQIVTAAFEAWGSTYFTSTSLALVSERLGVTKQAIYRHFPNKAALVEALTETFLNAYGEVRDVVVAVPQPATLRTIVERYAEGVWRMFEDLPQYYFFLVLKLLPGPEADRKRFYDLGDDISNIVQPHLLPDAADHNRPNGQQCRLSLMFMHVQLVVWSAFGFWTPLGQLRNGARELNAAQRDNRIAHTVELCLNGLFPGAELNIDYASVEQLSEVRQDELLEPNRFFAAVDAVVSEVGFERASLDRIAQQLDMTKSSLYFYFDNKDSMFSQALQTERRHFRDLFLARAVQLRGFSERLYGYIVAIASYYLNNRSLMVFSNWVQVQRVPVAGCTPDEQEVIQTADFIRQHLEGHSNPLRRDEAIETLALLSILMNRGIQACGLTLDRREELFAFTRDFYRTVSHGISVKERKIDDENQ